MTDAQATIERLRAATPGGQTCSAGISTWNRREPAAELIARADAVFYAAKPPAATKPSPPRPRSQPPDEA
jgi:hypothetical protein